jgi:hypothetical protein
MLYLFSHKGNANQNDTESPSNPSQNDNQENKSQHWKDWRDPVGGMQIIVITMEIDIEVP